MGKEQAPQWSPEKLYETNHKGHPKHNTYMAACQITTRPQDSYVASPCGKHQMDPKQTQMGPKQVQMGPNLWTQTAQGPGPCTGPMEPGSCI